MPLPSLSARRNFAICFAVIFTNVLLPAVAVEKCYSCLAQSWNDCDRTPNSCSASLLGKTHCYSVNGKYDNGSAILDGVARGCIDCSDKKKACESLKLVLMYTNYDLLTCNIECCDIDLCNSVVPQAYPTTSQQRNESILQAASILLTLITFLIWLVQGF